LKKVLAMIALAVASVVALAVPSVRRYLKIERM
jgi:Tfp pilus assembly major pilin PilA